MTGKMASLRKFTDDVGAEISLVSSVGPAVAISPDGSPSLRFTQPPAGVCWARGDRSKRLFRLESLAHDWHERTIMDAQRCSDEERRPTPLHFCDFCLSDFPIGMVITLWSVVSPS